MLPEISEFSYGYALISELVSRFGLKTAGAPEFATQYAEGKKGGGWDVKLPVIPVYIQIKRSDKMVRRNAYEASRFVNMPFYRMHIHRRDLSNQHRLLLDLEASGNVALYAAPGFSQSRELNRYYSKDEIVDNSIFIKPSTIGLLPDDEYHWVSFQINPDIAYFCSIPKRIEISPFSTILHQNIPGLLTEYGRQVDDFFLDRMSDELLSIYLERYHSSEDRKLIENIRRMRERRNSVDFVQLISRTLFNSELLFYGKEPKEN